jgi:hypothetical protein
MAARRGIGGWLLVLCLLLTIVEPLSLAIAWSGSVPQIVERGTPAVLLFGARVAVSATGVAAGLAIWRRKPHGATLGKAFFAAATLVSAMAYGTSILPDRPPPGLALPMFGLVAAYNLVWYLYLSRSARVAATLHVN